MIGSVSLKLNQEIMNKINNNVRNNACQRSILEPTELEEK